jgi:uncharacterized protein YndB with AHSA1/START domain
MTIAPIVHTVRTKAPPARAFELYTGRMGDWWPKGRTAGKNPHVAITVEPRVGGRCFEVDAEGDETRWGDVMAWEPPSRLLMAWRLNANWIYDPAVDTELELTFTPAEGGGTVVRLEHRKFESLGADAAKVAASLDGGWPGFVADYGAFADAHS